MPGKRIPADAREIPPPHTKDLDADAKDGISPIGPCSSTFEQKETSISDISSETNTLSKLLEEGAKYAYEKFFSKEYPEPPEDAAPAFFCDLEPQLGVNRPNHGLANGLRKAALVPLVANVFAHHYCSNAFDRKDFKFTPEHLEAIQLAILFEVSGRKSDIGYDDDPETFLSYHQQSCNNFDDYAKSKNIKSNLRKLCLEGLENMYCGPSAGSKKSRPSRHVMEMCHDLDLFRCYGEYQMKSKMDKVSHAVGKEGMQLLVNRAVHGILETGDRLLWAPGVPYRGYKSPNFVRCSTDPSKCIEVLKASILRGEKLEFSRPSIAGEAEVRFASSRYKILHAAQETKWRLGGWDDMPEYRRQELICAAYKDLIEAFCEKHKVATQAKQNFLGELHKVTKKAENTVDMAVLLWTSTSALNGRELCSIINEGLRTEGSWENEKWKDSSMQKAAVMLACVIQKHLNRNRRGFNDGPWPTGKEEDDRGFQSENNCVFRGSGLPENKEQAESVLRFYESLAQDDCKGPVYRVNGLLATSMFQGVAQTFLQMEDRIPRDAPKVRYTILLGRNRKGKPVPGLRPMHVAFLDKSEGREEYEFLFSAYSAFRVKSVERSDHATSASESHEITLVACNDNQLEDEDVPTAPWY